MDFLRYPPPSIMAWAAANSHPIEPCPQAWLQTQSSRGMGGSIESFLSLFCHFPFISVIKRIWQSQLQRGTGWESEEEDRVSMSGSNSSKTTITTTMITIPTLSTACQAMLLQAIGKDVVNTGGISQSHNLNCTVCIIILMSLWKTQVQTPYSTGHIRAKYGMSQPLSFSTFVMHIDQHPKGAYRAGFWAECVEHLIQVMDLGKAAKAAICASAGAPFPCITNYRFFRDVSSLSSGIFFDITTWPASPPSSLILPVPC